MADTPFWKRLLISTAIAGAALSPSVVSSAPLSEGAVMVSRSEGRIGHDHDETEAGHDERLADDETAQAPEATPSLGIQLPEAGLSSSRRWSWNDETKADRSSSSRWRLWNDETKADDQIIIKITKASSDTPLTPIAQAAIVLKARGDSQASSIRVEVNAGNEEISVPRSYLQELLKTLLEKTPELITARTGVVNAMIAYATLKHNKEKDESKLAKDGASTDAPNIEVAVYNCLDSLWLGARNFSDYNDALLFLVNECPWTARLDLARHVLRKHPPFDQRDLVD